MLVYQRVFHGDRMGEYWIQRSNDQKRRALKFTTMVGKSSNYMGDVHSQAMFDSDGFHALSIDVDMWDQSWILYLTSPHIPTLFWIEIPLM